MVGRFLGVSTINPDSPGVGTDGHGDRNPTSTSVVTGAVSYSPVCLVPYSFIASSSVGFRKSDPKIL